MFWSITPTAANPVTYGTSCLKIRKRAKLILCRIPPICAKFPFSQRARLAVSCSIRSAAPALPLGAQELGRKSIGIDISPAYIRLAEDRCRRLL